MYGLSRYTSVFPSAVIGAENTCVHTGHIRPILQRLMTKRGLSATRLAELSGVPQPTISRLLNGTTDTMTLETVIDLAPHLGVTVSQLIGETPIDEDEGRQKAYVLLQHLPAYQVPAAVKILDALTQPAPKSKNNSR